MLYGIPTVNDTGDDHFWFTLFHEAGHILLHGKREVFIENQDEGTIHLFAASLLAVRQLQAIENGG